MCLRQLNPRFVYIIQFVLKIQLCIDLFRILLASKNKIGYINRCKNYARNGFQFTFVHWNWNWSLYFIDPRANQSLLNGWTTANKARRLFLAIALTTGNIFFTPVQQSWTVLCCRILHMYVRLFVCREMSPRTNGRIKKYKFWHTQRHVDKASSAANFQLNSQRPWPIFWTTNVKIYNIFASIT